MNNINIGHNNPPKKTRDDLIKQRIELTKSLINNMKPKYNGLGKRITPQQYSDSKESGFYVVCSSKEKVSFWLTISSKRYFLSSQNLPVKSFTITENRELAKELKYSISKGVDPREVLKNKELERQKEKTFSQVIDEFSQKQIKNWKYSTRTAFQNRVKVWINFNTRDSRVRNIIDKNFKDLNIGRLKISAITRSVLTDYHKAIPYKYQANRILDDLRIIMKWAFSKGHTKTEINLEEKDFHEELKRIEKADPYSPEDWLKMRAACVKNILPWSHKQMDSVEKKRLVSKLAILLAYYTGRRYRSEVLALKWNEVDLKKSWISLKDTKEGPFSFPINSTAKAILYLLNRFKNIKDHPLNFKLENIKSRYVFPSMTKSKKNHINDIRKTFGYVCKTANVDIKCCYFLRHSFWTAQKNLSTDAKKVLGGWKSNDMVETYDKKTDKLKMEFRDQAAQTLLQYKSNR